jgi:hypothetical protein
MLPSAPPQEWGPSWTPRYAYVHRLDVICYIDTFTDGQIVVYEQPLPG